MDTKGEKPEILIAEDSPTQSEKLKYILEEKGFHVSVAANGKEAIDSLHKIRPKIVISDVLMPMMDGYELCKRIRSEKDFEEIPIVLLTSLSDPKDVIKGLESGANNFIVKPYDERYLLSRIDYLLANLEIRKNANASMGINVFFAGENYFITAERLQILDLLLSTYENAYHQNLELIEARNELKELNAQLEDKVDQRTSELREEIEERKQVEVALRASEAELHDNYFSQFAINMMLSESLKNIPLEECLQKALNIILSIPWVTFESFGSISLVEDEADVLVMKAQSNLSEPLKERCMRIPFGKCLCGKAAQNQKIEFADCIDERYEIFCKGTYPHGQYSVPILFSGRTLGVLNIYLKEGHIRSNKDEEFLLTVADTLAGIITRKKAEEKIEYLAYYDALTGLPNRNFFIERLKQEVAGAEPASKNAAVLITDIDRFKSVNDTYGNEVGDRVLNEVAEKLLTAVRKGDTVARLGNDEFGIALLDIDNLDDLIPVMEKIMKYISYPLKIGSDEIALTFSTGISLYPHDGEDAPELLKAAGLALEIAKREGGKTYRFYSEEMSLEAAERILLEKQLAKAYENKEFILYYQPYWDIVTKKMVGMEALVRWQSKDKGLVPPGKFIPVLEDTGMIVEVGEWVLWEAMRQVKEWQNKRYPVVPISVNLSSIQFRQKDLAGMVEKIVKDCDYCPSLLTLEITESAFMQDVEFTSSVLTALKGIGCSVSIDDFGTGYSSLAYLKKLPIDNLKIDISFIREVVQDPDSASIVMAIINMAHTLNLKTIAEGIETEEQWNFLRLLRCDMGQGFYLSKPLPAEEVEKIFNTLTL